MTLERIGPYRIVRKLGEGGMGAVYEAVQEPIGRRVAVKVLHPKYAAEPQITARFFNEARAVNLIDHPGIVQVSDYGQIPDGTAYLVMEFLKGDTLSQRMKKPGGMGLPDIVRLARQITAALAAAHEKNVFHRDLKPDNIMLVPDADTDVPGRERMKLLDFGIAKVATEEGVPENAPKTATDVVMGTPRYMAPEQCRGGIQIDGKADVYSLGVMLYEMLAGKPPFVGASGEVLAMHIYEAPPPLRDAAPHVPVEMTTLIHRLLAKKKEERPSMLEAQLALEQISLRHPTSVLQAIKWTAPPIIPSSTPSGSLNAATPTSGVSNPQIPSTLGLSTGQQAEVHPPRRTPRLWFAIGGSVLALGLAIGLWPLLHSSPKPVPPPELVPPPTSAANPPIQVAPARVHFSLQSTPPGAQVLHVGDDKVLGTTPWNSDESAATGQLDLRLHLPGYVDKVVHLDRSIDQHRAETLEAQKRPLRPGGGRPGWGSRPGQNPTAKPNPGGSTKDEQPRIVD